MPGPAQQLEGVVQLGPVSRLVEPAAGSRWVWQRQQQRLPAVAAEQFADHHVQRAARKVGRKLLDGKRPHQNDQPRSLERQLRVEPGPARGDLDTAGTAVAATGLRFAGEALRHRGDVGEAAKVIVVGEPGTLAPSLQLFPGTARERLARAELDEAVSP